MRAFFASGRPAGAAPGPLRAIRPNPNTHMDYTPPPFAVIDGRGGTLKNGYTWPSEPGTGTQAMPAIAPYN